MSRALHVVGSALCFSGIAAAAVYLAQGRWVDVAVLMLVGLGQVLFFLSFRTGLMRGLTSLMLLVAGVSAAELLYERIPGWDLVVHFAATGALAALWWGLLRTLRRRRPHRRAGRAGQARPAGQDGGVPAVVVGRAPYDDAPPGVRVAASALVGLVLAVVWELMELAGWLFVTPEIHIPPLDTLTDVIAGTAGAAAVGLLTPRHHGP